MFGNLQASWNTEKKSFFSLMSSGQQCMCFYQTTLWSAEAILEHNCGLSKFINANQGWFEKCYLWCRQNTFKYTLNLQILEFFRIEIMGLSLEAVWHLADYIPLWTYLWDSAQKILLSVGFFQSLEPGRFGIGQSCPQLNLLKLDC